MNKLHWIFPISIFLFFIVGLLFAHKLTSDFVPFLVATVVCLAVCFLGILGLAGWQHWLDFSSKKELQKELEMLGKAIEANTSGLTELRGKLAEAEGKLKNQKQAAPPELEKRLLDLAEKLRTKTSRESQNEDKISTTTTDEVPKEVRDFILEQLKPHFLTDKNSAA